MRKRRPKSRTAAPNAKRAARQPLPQPKERTITALHARFGSACRLRPSRPPSSRTLELTSDLRIARASPALLFDSLAAQLGPLARTDVSRRASSTRFPSVRSHRKWSRPSRLCRHSSGAFLQYVEHSPTWRTLMRVTPRLLPSLLLVAHAPMLVRAQASAAARETRSS